MPCGPGLETRNSAGGVGGRVGSGLPSRAVLRDLQHDYVISIASAQHARHNIRGQVGDARVWGPHFDAQLCIPTDPNPRFRAKTLWTQSWQEGIDRSMAPPVLYYDGMSQPCRAVLNLIKLNNLDVELKYVSIAKGSQRSEDFKAINPMCKLPFFVVGLLVGVSGVVVRGRGK